MEVTVERSHPTVVTVRDDGLGPGVDRWYLLRSDAHHDNVHCDQRLEKRHLEEARAREAGILDFGDLFCAMQGRWDKRADMNQFRPELRVSNYLDTLVSYCAEFYAPYAANWVLLAPGNHEDSILDHHQTNLTERLAERIRTQGSSVQVGTYHGWVRFAFRWHSTHYLTYRLRYTHGYAGGGQVTKDIIQANRQMVYLGNADFIVSGHTHDSWTVPIRRESLNAEGRPVLQDVECLKCPGYKDEYSCGVGYAARKGHPPKPLGAYWLRFYYERESVHYEITRAK